MGRITKVIGFSVPPSLAEDVERVAKAERRTKSELFREMFRVYQLYRKQREQGEERWVMDLIREAPEARATHLMGPEDFATVLKELARQVSLQAKKTWD
jgi:metal-responsive CopG/Arc/MetJ family transcriptional regulator